MCYRILAQVVIESRIAPMLEKVRALILIGVVIINEI